MLSGPIPEQPRTRSRRSRPRSRRRRHPPTRLPHHRRRPTTHRRHRPHHRSRPRHTIATAGAEPPCQTRTHTRHHRARRRRHSQQARIRHHRSRQHRRTGNRIRRHRHRRRGTHGIGLVSHHRIRRRHRNLRQHNVAHASTPGRRLRYNRARTTRSSNPARPAMISACGLTSGPHRARRLTRARPTDAHGLPNRRRSTIDRPRRRTHRPRATTGIRNRQRNRGHHRPHTQDRRQDADAAYPEARTVEPGIPSRHHNHPIGRRATAQLRNYLPHTADLPGESTYHSR